MYIVIVMEMMINRYIHMYTLYYNIHTHTHTHTIHIHIYIPLYTELIVAATASSVVNTQYKLNGVMDMVAPVAILTVVVVVFISVITTHPTICKNLRIVNGTCICIGSVSRCRIGYIWILVDI